MALTERNPGMPKKVTGRRTLVEGLAERLDAGEDGHARQRERAGAVVGPLENRHDRVPRRGVEPHAGDQDEVHRQASLPAGPEAGLRRGAARFRSG